MPIPSSGSLIIYPRTTTIVSGAFSVSGNGVGSASPLATAANLDTYYQLHTDNPATAPRSRFIDEIPAAGGVFVPSAGTYELSFSPDTSRLLFDPTGVADEINFLSADFPMGCLFSRFRLLFNGGYTSGPGRDRQFTNLSPKFAGTTVQSYTPPAGSFTGDILVTGFNSIIPFGVSWSPIQSFSPFGFSATIAAVISGLTDQPFFRNELFYIHGDYSANYWSFTLETPNALPGNIVEITDANNHLDKFSGFKVYWDTLEGEEDVDPEIPGLSGGVSIPENHILEFTTSRIKFILPTYLGIPYGGRRLMITGTGSGALFVGSFPIANLNIELVDGSGLYTLVEDQPYDTYYDRSTSPVETVDLKIPDPMVKTGFFPE